MISLKRGQLDQRKLIMLNSITPEEAFKLLSGKPDRPFDLFDVRSPQEYRGGHARGAQLVPLHQLNADVVKEKRKSPAEDPIFVICRSGSRSRTACERLIQQGLTNIVNIEGGTLAWMHAGLPVEQSVAKDGEGDGISGRWVRRLGLFGVLTSLALGWLVHPAFNFAAVAIWITLIVSGGGACPLGACSIRRNQT